MKKWLPIILVLFLLLGGYAYKSGLLNYENKNDDLSGREYETTKPLETVNENLGKTPIFLEFVADNCSYCTKMKPSVLRLKEQYGDKIKFVIADVDENEEAQQLAYYFKINAVPVVFIMDKEGKLSKRFDGYVKKEVLEKEIVKIIPKE